MALWVKICGVKSAEDALAAVEAGADAVGINFYEPSVRYCRPDAARGIVESLPEDFPVYGVFVRRGRAAIERTVAETGISGVKLHGDEPATEALGWSLPVIRAVRGTDSHSVRAAMAECTGYRLLVDSAAGGGSGKTVVESVLGELSLAESVLAGGLTPENVAVIVRRHRPFGVDTAGGVESAPGVKDARLIEEFVRNARSA